MAPPPRHVLWSRRGGNGPADAVALGINLATAASTRLVKLALASISNRSSNRQPATAAPPTPPPPTPRLHQIRSPPRPTNPVPRFSQLAVCGPSLVRILLRPFPRSARVVRIARGPPSTGQARPLHPRVSNTSVVAHSVLNQSRTASTPETPWPRPRPRLSAETVTHPPSLASQGCQDGHHRYLLSSRALRLRIASC